MCDYFFLKKILNKTGSQTIDTYIHGYTYFWTESITNNKGSTTNLDKSIVRVCVKYVYVVGYSLGLGVILGIRLE